MTICVLHSFMVELREEARNEELFCYLKQTKKKTFFSLDLSFLGDVLLLGWMKLAVPPLLSYTVVLFLMNRWIL